MKRKKKLVQWMARHRAKSPGLFLLVACYLCAAVLLLICQLGAFVANRVQYATGALVPQELTLDDFDLFEVDRNGDALLTVGADPQLVLKDKDRLVENLVVEASWRLPPRQAVAFWAKPGAAHSMGQMACGTGEGGALYLLPATGGRQLRLDPDTRAGNTITVHRIAINQPRPFWAFFNLSAVQLALLVTVPGLVASAVAIVARSGFAPKKRKKAGEAHG